MCGTPHINSHFNGTEYTEPMAMRRWWALCTDSCVMAAEILTPPVFFPHFKSFTGLHFLQHVGCLVLTLVRLLLCLRLILCFSDWLNVCPRVFRGSFYDVCWYCPLEIKVKSRGTRLILCNQQEKSVTSS